MVKLLAREAALVLLCGFFAQYVGAMVIGSAVPGLFLVGVMMALSFSAWYAMTVLAGNKMPVRVRSWLGVLAAAVTFLPDLPHGFGRDVAGALALPGAVLLGLGALRGRAEGALVALYSYSFPMLGVRWLLVPLVGANSAMAAVGLWTGAFYMALRGLVRLYWPESVEGNDEAGPLIHRPVPDQVVGLVEAASRLRARPYATLPDGGQDMHAISVVCLPSQAGAVMGRIQEFLAGSPFVATIGESVEGGVEVAVRVGKETAR